MKSYKLLMGLLLALVFWQCSKEDNIRVETNTTIIDDAEEVSFLIQVVDETGEVLPNATLSHNISGQSWQSDDRGLILLERLSVPSGGLPVSLESAGKMKMVKLLQGQEGKRTSLKLQLYPFDATSVIPTGGTGNIDDGGQLSLPSQLIREDGSIYTGEVTVKSHYYNPAEQGFLAAAPGNMSAIGVNGDSYALESYGMYAVELFDLSGSELSIPDGEQATLQFPLPANYSNVPDEMPIWSMDETSGKWVEEGMAQQDNGFLVAEVSHFSWWNCDVPFDPVTVCMRLVNDAGNPISGLGYLISTPDQQVFYNTGWTDEDGSFCTTLPTETAVSVSLYWEGNLLPPTSLGTFTADTDLGDVTMSLGSNFHIQGIGVDCDNLPMDNALVVYSQGGATGYTLSGEEGIFQMLVPSTGQLEVQLFDYQSAVQSLPQIIQIQSAQSSYNLDSVMVCEDLTGGSGLFVNEDITENTTWTSGNTYIISGRIFVHNGATLTIEPGTVIKGDIGEGVNASLLTITQGSKIIAEGTPQLPIVFTSVVDDISPEDIAAGNFQSPNLTPEDHALWGGVLILGEAPISATYPPGNDATEVSVESLDIMNTGLDLYGGNDPNDNSGSLSYVSLRHGGVNIGLGNEINGLSLGGVGNGTTIDHIEVIGFLDDGVEVFGGTVNIQNLVVWNVEDDAFDVDQAWGGTLDNFVLYTPGRSAFELDGPEASLMAKHTIQNGTVVMNDGVRSAQSFLVDLDDNTECDLKNIHFVAPFENWQIVTNHEVNPETTFENITFDIDPTDFGTLFNPDAPIPGGCSAGGNPEADVTILDWTWASQAGILDGL